MLSNVLQAYEKGSIPGTVTDKETGSSFEDEQIYGYLNAFESVPSRSRAGEFSILEKSSGKVFRDVMVGGTVTKDQKAAATTIAKVLKLRVKKKKALEAIEATLEYIRGTEFNDAKNGNVAIVRNPIFTHRQDGDALIRITLGNSKGKDRRSIDKNTLFITFETSFIQILDDLYIHDNCFNEYYDGNTKSVYVSMFAEEENHKERDCAKPLLEKLLKLLKETDAKKIQKEGKKQFKTIAEEIRKKRRGECTLILNEKAFSELKANDYKFIIFDRETGIPRCMEEKPSYKSFDDEGKAYVSKDAFKKMRKYLFN